MGMVRKAPEIPRPDDKPDRYAVYAFTVPESIFSAEQFWVWEVNKSSVPVLFFRTEDEKVYFDVLNPWDYIVRESIHYYTYWKQEESNQHFVRTINAGKQKSG